MEALEATVNYGPLLAVAGAALAAILGGIGSTLGVNAVGQASAGVAAENPDVAGKLIVLTALPGSQGIYGLVVAFLVINGGLDVDMITGWQIFGACLPLAITGLFSGIFQGKVAAAGANIVAKHPEKSGSGLILAAIVETFAILGLLVSILMLNAIS